MFIVGLLENVITTAETLELPHPFDKAMYPYRSLFIDPSETIIVLK